MERLEKNMKQLGTYYIVDIQNMSHYSVGWIDVDICWWAFIK